MIGLFSHRTIDFSTLKNTHQQNGGLVDAHTCISDIVVLRLLLLLLLLPLNGFTCTLMQSMVSSTRRRILSATVFTKLPANGLGKLFPLYHAYTHLASLGLIRLTFKRQWKL